MPGLKIDGTTYPVKVYWYTGKSHDFIIKPFIHYKGVAVYSIYPPDIIDYTQVYTLGRLVSAIPSEEFLLYLENKFGVPRSDIDDVVFLVSEDKVDVIE